MNENLINPLVLAYMGDAIYELLIRERLIKNKINKVNELQKECTKYVNAKGQAEFMNKLIKNNFLSENEIDVYKRGRNSKVNSHPNNTSIIIYKEATGFEAMLGYLYLKDNIKRINEIISFIMEG